MSRSQEKLKKVEDEINEYISPTNVPLPPPPPPHTHKPTLMPNSCSTHRREIYKCEVVITVNFSDGMDNYPNITEQLKDLDVSVLSKLLTKTLH